MVSDSPKGHLMAWMCIFFLLAGGGMVMSPAAAQPLAPVRSYTLYQPTIRHVTIHEGKLSPGHYGYNHMASVERFNGRFYAVWGGNASTILEGKPGQVILLSTSEDFVNWTPPVNFVGEGAENPLVDAEGVQWQPNLLNFQDKELWCVWFFHSKNDQLGGTYFSKLGKQSGAKWVNRRIFHRQMLDGRPCVGFASQNPVLLQSGRVLAPVTLYHGSGKGTRRQWNACLYTDDEGTTWQCSNP
ncbi:MAG: exo-alpha-sialidase, partial [Planctomycetes bacterium]|nr:exo-alpha-sialidase [Planctomycetota bacterium]